MRKISGQEKHLLAAGGVCEASAEPWHQLTPVDTTFTTCFRFYFIFLEVALPQKVYTFFRLVTGQVSQMDIKWGSGAKSRRRELGRGSSPYFHLGLAISGIFFDPRPNLRRERGNSMQLPG